MKRFYDMLYKKQLRKNSYKNILYILTRYLSIYIFFSRKMLLIFIIFLYILLSLFHLCIHASIHSYQKSQSYQRIQNGDITSTWTRNIHYIFSYWKTEAALAFVLHIHSNRLERCTATTCRCTHLKYFNLRF